MFQSHFPFGISHFSFFIYYFAVYHPLIKAAIIVTQGGVEGLEIREVTTPASPGADRVRVRVRAAGLNRADILQRMGHYPAPPGYPQDIPGIEFAGEVSDVGDEVRTWKVGDRV